MGNYTNIFNQSSYTKNYHQLSKQTCNLKHFHPAHGSKLPVIIVTTKESSTQSSKICKVSGSPPPSNANPTGSSRTLTVHSKWVTLDRCNSQWWWAVVWTWPSSNRLWSNRTKWGDNSKLWQCNSNKCNSSKWSSSNKSNRQWWISNRLIINSCRCKTTLSDNNNSSSINKGVLNCNSSRWLNRVNLRPTPTSPRGRWRANKRILAQAITEEALVSLKTWMESISSRTWMASSCVDVISKIHTKCITQIRMASWKVVAFSRHVRNPVSAHVTAAEAQPDP